MIGRIVVRQEFSLEQFKQIITGRGIFQKKMQTKSVLKETLRRLLGDRFYNGIYEIIYCSDE